MLEIVEKVGVAIVEPMLPTDIEVCHHVSVPHSTAQNIVELTCRNKRHEVLAHARKRRVSCDEVDMRSNALIRVNEHLCLALKKLLGMTIAKKKQCQPGP